MRESGALSEPARHALGLVPALLVKLSIETANCVRGLGISLRAWNAEN